MAEKGFRLPERTLTLRFEGTDFDGAMVRCNRSVSVGTVERIEELAAAAKRGDSQPGDSKLLYDIIGTEVIHEWNILDKSGKKIPADKDGVRKVDSEFFNLVVTHWTENVGNVAAPLEDKSSNGSSPVSLLEGMEKYSESPASPVGTDG